MIRILRVRYRGTKMKKTVTIVLITVIVVSAFAACSVNGSTENISTTAVTDSQGQTLYYEPATDEDGKTVTDTNGNTVFAQIETLTNGNAVTKENGEYVTNANTTVLAGGTNGSDSNAKPPSSGEKTEDADNEVPFDPTTETSPEESKTETTSATENTTQVEETTQSATDADGWINKWY